MPALYRQVHAMCLPLGRGCRPSAPSFSQAKCRREKARRAPFPLSSSRKEGACCDGAQSGKSESPKRRLTARPEGTSAPARRGRPSANDCRFRPCHAWSRLPLLPLLPSSKATLSPASLFRRPFRLVVSSPALFPLLFSFLALPPSRRRLAARAARSRLPSARSAPHPAAPGHTALAPAPVASDPTDAAL